MPALEVNQLPLAPLGAGDLIDRAVRLYRRHFMTLIRIAAPPVIVSAIGSTLWTIGVRDLMAVSSETSLALHFILAAAGVALMFTGALLNLVVMGGATRNLVTHLLWNEPVSVRATYRAVRARFWGLLGAAIIVGLWVSFTGLVTITAWYFVLVIVFIGAFAFAAISPAWFSALIGILGTITTLIGALWLFFFLAGRVAYVPQVMLVEGKGVFAALGRSFKLARGNVRRLMAMTFFTWTATYSALMILVIPLGWYGYVSGVDLSPWDSQNWPAWFAIGYSVLAQSSYILLAPVWMLGLSLLYVDERVRHEGYDIELMAARQLGEMPKFPGAQTGPYVPAITQPSDAPARTAASWSHGSTLGLR